MRNISIALLFSIAIISCAQTNIEPFAKNCLTGVADARGEDTPPVPGGEPQAVRILEPKDENVTHSIWGWSHPAVPSIDLTVSTMDSFALPLHLGSDIQSQSDLRITQGEERASDIGVELTYKGPVEFNCGSNYTIHAELRNKTERDLYICKYDGLITYLNMRTVWNVPKGQLYPNSGKEGHWSGVCVGGRLIYRGTIRCIVGSDTIYYGDYEQDYYLLKSGEIFKCMSNIDIPYNYPTGMTKLFFTYHSSYNGHKIGLQADIFTIDNSIDVEIKAAIPYPVKSQVTE